MRIMGKAEREETAAERDRLANAGPCALALTVVTVLGLIFFVALGASAAVVVLGASAAVTATVIAGICFALAWLALPAAVLRRQRREGDRS
jgi:protein-S-isoprenylcysteine O-methyltransferase Ste14